MRLAGRARTTRDVDIEWRADEEELLDALIEAVGCDVGDFFDFSIERAGKPEDHLGGSQRFRVAGSLGGRLFEAFPLDVGVRSEPEARAETLTVPNLLAFAGLGPVTVPASPLEIQTAEKLHAYTRTYEDSKSSTRTKDLVDLALISELSSPDAAELRGEIEATFAYRDTHPVPPTLPRPPENWRTPFRQLARAVDIPDDLRIGHRTAAAMVDPVLEGAVEQGLWNPETKQWNAPPDRMHPQDRDDRD